MKTILNAFFLLCISLLVQAQSLSVGEKFPIENLDFYQNKSAMKIVAFVPSLSPDCEYASMLTTALKYYFVDGLAFSEVQQPEIDIILIVKDTDFWKKNSSLYENRNKLEGLVVIYDSLGKYYKTLNISLKNPKEISQQKADTASTLSKKIVYKNENNEVASTLFLLDKDNDILLKDDGYKAQGEHLKPIENKIREIQGLTCKTNTYPVLKVGDKAPDFEVSKGVLLSSVNKIKLISFYPAAFSGKLARKNVILDKLTLMYCSLQLDRLDRTNINELYGNKRYDTYAISTSTPELLALWKSELETDFINYVNDDCHQIAQQYSAYNYEKGYENRASYVIDSNGIIRYIDTNFSSFEVFVPIINQLVKEESLKNKQ